MSLTCGSHIFLYSNLLLSPIIFCGTQTQEGLCGRGCIFSPLLGDAADLGCLAKDALVLLLFLSGRSLGKAIAFEGCAQEAEQIVQRRKRLGFSKWKKNTGERKLCRKIFEKWSLSNDGKERKSMHSVLFSLCTFQRCDSWTVYSEVFTGHGR